MKKDELIWLLKIVPQCTLFFLGSALYAWVLLDKGNVGFQLMIVWLIIVPLGLVIIRFGHLPYDIMERYNNWSDRIIEKYSRKG